MIRRLIICIIVVVILIKDLGISKDVKDNYKWKANITSCKPSWLFFYLGFKLYSLKLLIVHKNWLGLLKVERLSHWNWFSKNWPKYMWLLNLLLIIRVRLLLWLLLQIWVESWLIVRWINTHLLDIYLIIANRLWVWLIIKTFL